MKMLAATWYGLLQYLLQGEKVMVQRQVVPSQPMLGAAKT